MGREALCRVDSHLLKSRFQHLFAACCLRNRRRHHSCSRRFCSHHRRLINIFFSLLLLLLNLGSFLHDLIVLLLGHDGDISVRNLLINFLANVIARYFLSVLIDYFALVGLTAHLTPSTLLVDFLDRRRGNFRATKALNKTLSELSELVCNVFFVSSEVEGLVQLFKCFALVARRQIFENRPSLAFFLLILGQIAVLFVWLFFG